MTRNKHGFSTDYNERKAQPIVTGVLDYFPLAILAVAEVSADGNAQHNPGEPLHWAREKSQDEVNTEARHLLERGTKDGNVLHSAKKAWRALADLQKEIEASLCDNPECEVHVHNQDRGGSCALLPRAATWYGRTRDDDKPPAVVAPPPAAAKPAGTCFYVRTERNLDDFPCVLRMGHEDRHVDRDGEEFNGVPAVFRPPSTLEPGRLYRILRIAEYDTSPRHRVGDVVPCSDYERDGHINSEAGNHWFVSSENGRDGGTYVTEVEFAR
jgi:hypothetical protein